MQPALQLYNPSQHFLRTSENLYNAPGFASYGCVALAAISSGQELGPLLVIDNLITPSIPSGGQALGRT